MPWLHTVETTELPLSDPVHGMHAEGGIQSFVSQAVGNGFGLGAVGQINALAGGGTGTTDPKKTGAGAGGNNLINQVPR